VPPPTWEEMLAQRMDDLVEQASHKDADRGKLAEELILIHLLAGDMERAGQVAQSSTEASRRMRLLSGSVLFELGQDAQGVDMLREAFREITQDALLEIHKTAFVSRVFSFGRIQEIPSPVFKSNQLVMVYCEMDHFVCKQVRASEYQVAFEVGYEIYGRDAFGFTGTLFWEKTPHDVLLFKSGSYVNDYFMNISFRMPVLNAGSYTLKLVITDKLKDEVCEEMLDFSIE